ncbi:MAG: hypothetical protein LBT01_07930 [Spirochaetaceae bacterium]|jgi:hypothetical protein|nr:hypothetical protein [Spirochaetaceae bacterium]
MKKIFGIVLAASLVFGGLVSCATGGGASAKPAMNIPGVPDFVNDAYNNSSEDVIVGVGMYKIGNDLSKMSIGRDAASTRADVAIAREISNRVQNMFKDYTATSEQTSDMVSYQENVTRALAQATLVGSKQKLMQTYDGMLYVVKEYSVSAAKALAQKTAADQATALKIPAAKAQSALADMDAQLDKQAGIPVPVGD